MLFRIYILKPMPVLCAYTLYTGLDYIKFNAEFLISQLLKKTVVR